MGRVFLPFRSKLSGVLEIRDSAAEEEQQLQALGKDLKELFIAASSAIANVFIEMILDRVSAYTYDSQKKLTEKLYDAMMQEASYVLGARMQDIFSDAQLADVATSRGFATEMVKAGTIEAFDDADEEDTDKDTEAFFDAEAFDKAIAGASSEEYARIKKVSLVWMIFSKAVIGLGSDFISLFVIDEKFLREHEDGIRCFIIGPRIGTPEAKKVEADDDRHGMDLVLSGAEEEVHGKGSMQLSGDEDSEWEQVTSSGA